MPTDITSDFTYLEAAFSKTVTWTKGYDQGWWFRFLREIKIIQYDAHDTIYQPDKRTGALYWVIQGKVVEQVEKRNKVWLERTLGPGAYFGQQGLYQATLHSAATAQEPTQIFQVTPAGLRTLLEQRTAFYDEMLPEARASRLRKLPLFRSMTDDEIRWLALVVGEESVAAGAAVPLTTKSGLWIITAGQIRAISTQGSERYITAGNFLLSPDSAVGPGPYVVEKAQAIAATRVFYLSDPHITRLAAAFGDVAKKLEEPLDIAGEWLAAKPFRDPKDTITHAHLQHLARFVAWEFVPAEQNITTQGSAGHSFVYLRDGEAVVTGRDDQGRPRPVNYLAAHESFGETSLLEGKPREVSVRAVRGGGKDAEGMPLNGTELLVLDRRDLSYAMAQNPGLWHRGVALFDNMARQEETKKIYEWLDEGEEVRWRGRKHWIWPFSQMAVAAIPFLGLYFIMWSFLGNMNLLVPALVFLFYAIVWVFILINYLDDYYAITNKRVVRRDRFVIFYLARYEAPLSMVQDITIKQSLVASLLNFGNMEIRTAAKEGWVRFNGVPQPAIVKAILLSEKVEASAAEEGNRRETIRRHLTQELKLTLPIPQRERALGDNFQPPVRQSWLMRLYTRLFRRRARLAPPPTKPKYGAGEIVWRKHWLNLARRVGLPLTLLLGWLVVLFVLDLLAQQGTRSFFAVLMGWIFVFLGLLLWVLWHWIDYYNDLYVLTDSSIIDIEIDIKPRPPFYSRNRREGGLDRVQTVNFSQKNLIERLFNYGDVTIRTAAADEGYTFRFVGNPRAVQSQVVQKLQAFRRKQQEKDLLARQREFVASLDVYHELVSPGRQTQPPGAPTGG